MKALLVEKLPAGDSPYEVKFDGYRALAFKNGKEVRLVSRNDKEFTYSQLLDALNYCQLSTWSSMGKLPLSTKKAGLLSS
jgi:hypothetical protein